MVWNHVLDTILGKKYYFCLLHYPNIRVVPDQQGSKPTPLYETSSSIFFTLDEARQFLDENRPLYPSDYLVADEIHTFRTHKPVTPWSKYREHKSPKSRLV